MASPTQFEVEVGEALPIGVTTDFDMTGATVAARVSVNDAAAVDVSGSLDAAVAGVVKTALVPIPGSTFTAAGWATGVVTITKADAPWSPAKERFQVSIRAVV